MTQMMTHVLPLIELPIRLQCLCVPMTWEVRTIGIKGVAPNAWFFPERNKQKATDGYDPWEVRGNFFRLQEGDNGAAIEFLNKVGLFDSPDVATSLAIQASRRELTERITSLLRDSEDFEGVDGPHTVKPRSATAFPAHAFWEFRRLMLEEMKPRESVDLSRWDYGVRFAALVRLGAAAIVTTTAFKDALAASIRIDQLRKAKFKVCKRPDCSIPFAQIGKKKMKYCQWYCGHIESVRKSRRQK